MTLQASDIKLFGSQNIAETNYGIHGGAIDTSIEYFFDNATIANNPAISGDGTLRAYSDDAGENSTCVIYGVAAFNAAEQSGILILNGTEVATGTTYYDQIWKITFPGGHDGTVILTDSSGHTIFSIENGINEVRRPFYNVSADHTGGDIRVYYEKIFIKNVSPTDGLYKVKIREVTDSEDVVTFTVEDAQNDNEYIASRRDTAPTGINESFSNTEKAIPGLDLNVGGTIGLWLKLNLGVGESATKTLYSLGVSGIIA